MVKGKSEISKSGLFSKILYTSIAINKVFMFKTKILKDRIWRDAEWFELLSARSDMFARIRILLRTRICTFLVLIPNVIWNCNSLVLFQVLASTFAFTATENALFDLNSVGIKNSGTIYRCLYVKRLQLTCWWSCVYRWWCEGVL